MKTLANYSNPKKVIGFAGKNIISRYSSLPRHKINSALAKHQSYVLHREVKKPRVYNPFILYDKRELLQADLVDLASRSGDNDGYKYILIVCDSFTRKCWARPLKNKTTGHVLENFREIYSSSGHFERLMTDAGTEFLSKQFKQFLSKESIGFTRGNPHAPHVERLNRTLQTKIFKYMTQNETKRWIDILSDVVAAYNDRYHRIIRMSPNEAEQDKNKTRLLENVSLYYHKALSRRKEPKFKVGDVVSVQKLRNVFAKGYEQLFTDELFRVSEIHTKLPIPMYSLVEYDGETVIEGRFYENEMQLAEYEVYKVEKVLRKRVTNNTEEVYVKWKGWPARYNQWIPASDIEIHY